MNFGIKPHKLIIILLILIILPHWKNFMKLIIKLSQGKHLSGQGEQDMYVWGFVKLKILKKGRWLHAITLLNKC